jgi:hypothetical protein
MRGYSQAKDPLGTNIRTAARAIEFFNNCRFTVFPFKKVLTFFISRLSCGNIL